MRSKPFLWSDDELEFLKSNFDSMTYKEIALKLVKTKDGVKRKCKLMNLRKTTRHVRHIKHGMTKSRLYRAYKQIVQRSTNVNHLRAKDYSLRGIGICDEWLSSFESFRDWSFQNGYAEGLQIDRINNDLGYSPNNCRWVTPKIQSNNRRTNVIMTGFGETKSIIEWSRDSRCVVKYSCIRMRIREAGWNNIEEIITIPADKSGHNSTHRAVSRRDVPAIIISNITSKSDEPTPDGGREPVPSSYLVA
jgi:hypothetical protein